MFAHKRQMDGSVITLEVSPGGATDHLTDDGFIITDFRTLHEYEANNIIGQDLRVKYLIHPDFRNLSPAKIDFTLHLNENITLIKKITMSPNGRPVRASYYYPSVADMNLICFIDYKFIDNNIGFMIQRSEELSYLKVNGESVGPFIIHKRQFDFANIIEATVSIKERSDARRNIIDEIKVFLNGVIINVGLASGLTQTQANINAINIGGKFIRIHNDLIQAFIETASFELRTYLQTAEATGDEAFLDFLVAPNVRVRDYFINRISY